MSEQITGFAEDFETSFEKINEKKLPTGEEEWVEAKKTREQFGKSNKIYIEDGYLTLDIVYPYDIELSRLNTPAKILNWFFHLKKKTWMTSHYLAKFIEIASLQIPKQVFDERL
jgi:hypothetical protein